MAGMLYNQMINADVGFDENGDISKESRAEANDLAQRLSDESRRNTIEKHSEKYRAARNVLDGETSFYEMGRPIIERAEAVEAELGRRKMRFGWHSKWDILGKDGRDVNEPRETTDYLREQRIIDPKVYFNSGVVVPEITSNFSDGVSRLFDDKKGNLSPVRLFGFITGTMGCGAVLGKYYSGPPGVVPGAILGAIPYLFTTLVFAVPKERGAEISRGREAFESALRYMDDEVYRLFPRDGQRDLRLVSA